MKIIKSPVELPVEDKYFTLITKLNSTYYLYGNTYWLMQHINKYSDSNVDMHLDRAKRLADALAPLKKELEVMDETEQDHRLDDWFGSTNIVTLTQETIPVFIGYYEESSNKDILADLSEFETVDGYSVSQLLILLNLDSLVAIEKEMEEAG